MNIQTKQDGNVTVIIVDGELDGKTAPEAQNQILPLIEPSGKVLLDMSNVLYMSSAGLRMMLLIYRQVSASNGSSVLVGLSEELKDTMEATGFLRYFDLAEDYKAGIEMLKD